MLFSRFFLFPLRLRFSRCFRYIQYSRCSQLLTALVLLFLAASAHSMTLTSQVDRTTISINDTLILTVTLDRQGANAIDLSELELQFDVLQRRRSSQTSFINGKIQSQTQWIVVLAPKETGQLLVPSLSSMGVFSDAIPITVLDRNATGAINPNASTANQNQASNNIKENTQGNTQSNTSNNDVFLEATIDKPSVYVQEQILLTLRFYYRIPLSAYTPEDLSIANSSIEALSEKNIKTQVNGVEYNVLEKIYAIHPQASGTLTIPAQAWRAEKARSRFAINRSGNPYVRASSQALSVEVKSIPAASTANHWLPASQLSLTQDWQQSRITAKVGEPLNYTLSLQAEGLQFSQLPTINIDSSDDFTVYNDKADTNNALSVSGITGTRNMQYAVIPKKAGAFTLPAITLKWWNTTSNKEETISLKPQQIIVANTELNQQQAIDFSNTGADQSVLGTETRTGTGTAKEQSTHWLWPTSTLLLALLSALFFVLWRLSARALTMQAANTEIKPQPIDLSLGSKKALPAIYQQMETAITQEQWAVLLPLIYQWASITSQQTISNTTDVTNHFPDLTPLLDSLNKQLYSASSVVAWDAKTLIDLLKRQSVNRNKDYENKGLADLYNN